MGRVFNGIKVCKGVHKRSAVAFFPRCNTILVLSMSVFLGRFNLTLSSSCRVSFTFVYATFRRESDTRT